MKICHIQHSFYPELGGMQTNTFETLKSLNQLGNEVFIVTGNNNKNQFLKYEKIKGINVFRANKVQNSMFYRKFFRINAAMIIWLFNMVRLCLKVVLRYKIDIIHAHSRDAAFIAYLVHLITGRPIVNEIHQYDLFCFRNGMLYDGKEFCGGPQIEKCGRCINQSVFIFGFQFIFSWYTMRTSRKILVPGNYVKKIIKPFFPKSEINVVQNGFDLESFKVSMNKNKLREKYNLPADKLVLLFVGRFVPEKGPQIFMDSIPKVLKNLQNVYFVFVGFGPMLKQIKKTIENLRIKENVKIIPSIPKNYIQEIYSAADIFIFSSLIPDPFPNVVLEAMGAGLPIIGANLGGITEMIKNNENGFLIPPGNSEKLANEIVYLISNNLISEMSQNSLKLIKSFSWEQKARRLIEIYSDLIE